MFSTSSHRKGTRAIVIGGSMAGLAAARVLQPHFDQVVILDRDVLSDIPEHRQGVPQGRHAHGLLAGGLRALSTLFPTLEADLRAAGAVAADVVRDIRWHQHGYDKLQFQSGLDGLLLGRPLLEATLRAHVRRLPRVSFADKVVVQRLLVSADGRTVTGVRIRPFGCPEYSCHADLVVDASGRSSRSPQWLAEQGFEPPPLDELAVNIGYMTRIYHRRPDDLGGNVGTVIAPRPPHQRRIGFALALEGDRWIVGLGGWMGDHAPADPDGYLAFARSLARPYIYDLISRAEPLSEPVPYAFPLESEASLRAGEAPAGTFSRDGRRTVQLQPNLRPGHERGRARGIGPRRRDQRAGRVDGARCPFLPESGRDCRRALGGGCGWRSCVRGSDRPPAGGYSAGQLVLRPGAPRGCDGS